MGKTRRVIGITGLSAIYCVTPDGMRQDQALRCFPRFLPVQADPSLLSTNFRITRADQKPEIVTKTSGT